MLQITAPLLTVLCLLAGCADDAPWIGTYAASGTWNLGGPLAGGRTVGDAVADLLVDKIVALSGVPSPLEDKAHDAASRALRGPVKAVVDKNAPAELAPDGAVTRALAAALAAARVDSTITLEEGLLPGSMKGTESVTAISYQHGGQDYRLDAAALAGAGVAIAATWEGDEGDGQTLEVDPHAVEIRYGELVRRVADHAVDAAGQTKLKDEVHTAVGCDAIVAQILGGGAGLKLSVADWSYTVGDAQLKSACAAVASLVQGRILGLFALDTGVEVGGGVSWSGDPAGSLSSGPDFGGVVNVAPHAIAPRVTVSFTAQR